MMASASCLSVWTIWSGTVLVTELWNVLWTVQGIRDADSAVDKLKLCLYTGPD